MAKTNMLTILISFLVLLSVFLWLVFLTETPESKKTTILNDLSVTERELDEAIKKHTAANQLAENAKAGNIVSPFVESSGFVLAACLGIAMVFDIMKSNRKESY